MRRTVVAKRPSFANDRGVVASSPERWDGFAGTSAYNVAFALNGFTFAWSVDGAGRRG